MASGDKGGDKPGFTVTDRRSVASEPEDEPASAAPAEPAVASEAPGALPAVDFHTFVLSLGSSALLHLGELDHPDGGPPRPDLALAKHTIDIISMLQEKTKGNLTPPEDRLVESLLYDLRLRYVEKSKAASPPRS